MTTKRKALLIITPHQVRQVPQAPGTDQQTKCILWMLILIKHIVMISTKAFADFYEIYAIYDGMIVIFDKYKMVNK